MISPYITHLLILIGIFIILAVSLNFALGYTGLLNLGHVAFFGIGAYTSAILTKMGVPFIIAFILAGLVASVFGYLLVLATGRLKGDYLALATLGFSFVMYSLMLNWISLTRGPLGIPGISKPSFGNIIISSNTMFLVFIITITLISVIIMKNIIESPFGRLLQAVRDDELGLKVLGKNTFALKWKAMMISAFFAGIAGSAYAHYISFIDPGTFYLTAIILLLTIVIAGGVASWKGSIIATIIIVLIPELLRFLPLPSAVQGALQQIVYALILIIILLYRPRGILGRVDLT